MTGVPAGVKDHNPVRSDQVHTKASRSRGHKEEFHLVVSGGLVDHLSGSCVSAVLEKAFFVSYTGYQYLKWQYMQVSFFLNQTFGFVLNPVMSRSRSIAGVDPSRR